MTNKVEEMLHISSDKSEAGLLGCLLLESNLVDELDLVPEELHWQHNRLILDRIISLHSENGTVDTKMLFDSLHGSKQMREAGGAYYVTTLVNATTTPKMADAYLECVKRSHRRRKLADIGSELYFEASGGVASPERLARRFSSLLEDVPEQVNVANAGQLAALANTFVKSMGKTQGRITPTPFDSLNGILGGGLRSQTISVVAARPGVGKSTFAVCMMSYLARIGTPVLFYSLEMSREQVAVKLIENMSGIGLFSTMTEALKSVHAERVCDAIFRLSELPMQVIEGMREMEAICRHAKLESRRCMLKYGKRPLVVVDYLQKARPTEPTGVMCEDVGRMTDLLCDLAKEENLPVLLLSQLNRALETRKSNPRPVLSDLKSSGDIEQDAAVVMFLSREGLSDPKKHKDDLQVIVAKNRFGSTGDSKMRFRGEVSRIEEGDR